MSTLYWIRIARKFTGLKLPAELPNLETLLEAESDQPSNDYRMLSYALPSVFATSGLVFLVPLIVTKILWFVIPIILFVAGAVVAWFVCDRLDKSIPQSRARIRKLSEELVKKFSAFTNIVGVDPAISPNVGAVLDEAAGIYLKHIPAMKDPLCPSHNAALALEAAMARIMDLSVPVGIPSQEIELAKDWAQPLLQEMRDTDKVIADHAQSGLTRPQDDPRAALREARIELQMSDAAAKELHLGQSE